MKLKISKDFLLYSLLTCILILAISIYTVWSSWNAYLEQRKYNNEIEAIRVSQSLAETLDYIHNFMTYFGQDIAKEKNITPKKVAKILQSKFDNRNAGQDVFTWTGYDYVTPEGYVVASTGHGIISNPVKVEENVREWMVTARSNPWKLNSSKVDIGVISREPILPLAVGIADKKDNFLGYVSMGLNINKLSRKLEKATSEKETNFVILDYKHNLVTASSRTGAIPVSFFRERLFHFKGNDAYKKLDSPVELEDIVYTHYLTLKKYPFAILLGDNTILSSIYFQNEVLPKVFYLGILFLCFLVLLYFFRKKVITPVNQLVRAIHNVRSSETSMLGKFHDKDFDALRSAILDLENYMGEDKERMRKLETDRLVEKHSNKELEKFLYYADKRLGSHLTLASNDNHEVMIEKVSLKEIIRQQVEISNQIAYENGITITYKIGPHTIKTDKLLLSMIIGGLVRHQINTLAEGNNIHICTESNQDSVTITVVDNGEGVTNMPFHKKSSGYILDMNLGTIHMLLDKIGGNMQEEASYKEGTTYMLQIPLTLSFSTPASQLDDDDSDNGSKQTSN